MDSLLSSSKSVMLTTTIRYLALRAKNLHDPSLTYKPKYKTNYFYNHNFKTSFSIKADSTQSNSTQSLKRNYGYMIIFAIAISPIIIMVNTIRNGLKEDFTFADFLKQLKQAKNPSIVSMFLPQCLTGNLMHFFATIERPRWFTDFLLKLFMNAAHISLKDAIYHDLSEYQNVQKLFTRKLKADARPIDFNSSIVSPCDGQIVNVGEIDLSSQSLGNTTLEYVKGQRVNLKLFLGENYADTLQISHDNNLYFAILYLAPNNYHCFHSPTDWKIDSIQRIPGSSYPVSPDYVRMLPGEACVNERVVLKGKWQHGEMFVIPIGAMNVGGIVLTQIQQISTIPSKYWPESQYTNINLSQKKAEILGEFLLGSTVVLIFEAPKNSHFVKQADSEIEVGQALF